MTHDFRDLSSHYTPSFGADSWDATYRRPSLAYRPCIIGAEYGHIGAAAKAYVPIGQNSPKKQHRKARKGERTQLGDKKRGQATRTALAQTIMLWVDERAKHGKSTPKIDLTGMVYLGGELGVEPGDSVWWVSLETDDEGNPIQRTMGSPVLIATDLSLLNKKMAKDLKGWGLDSPQRKLRNKRWKTFGITAAIVAAVAVATVLTMGAAGVFAGTASAATAAGTAATGASTAASAASKAAKAFDAAGSLGSGAAGTTIKKLAGKAGGALSKGKDLLEDDRTQQVGKALKSLRTNLSRGVSQDEAAVAATRNLDKEQRGNLVEGLKEAAEKPPKLPDGASMGTGVIATGATATGAGLGFAVGGPVGAAVGAGVGLLAGLLGGKVVKG